MRDTPRNLQKAIEKAKDLLATPLERIPDVGNILLGEQGDLGLLNWPNTKKSLREFLETQDLDDLPILPDRPAPYTVKDFLWGQLYAEFHIPVDSQTGLDRLASDSNLESGIKEMARDAYEDADNHPPGTWTEGLFDRDYAAYVSFLQALDAMAEGKEPSHAQKQGLRDGLKHLQAMLSTASEKTADIEEEVESPAENEKTFHNRVAGKLSIKLLDNPDAADVPEYITDEIRGKARAAEQQPDAERTLDLLNAILALVRQHKPRMTDEDQKIAKETTASRAPKSEILTHIISELLQINKHLGISGKGGGRGGRGSSPQDG